MERFNHDTSYIDTSWGKMDALWTSHIYFSVNFTIRFFWSTKWAHDFGRAHSRPALVVPCIAKMCPLCAQRCATSSNITEKTKIHFWADECAHTCQISVKSVPYICAKTKKLRKNFLLVGFSNVFKFYSDQINSNKFSCWSHTSTLQYILITRIVTFQLCARQQWVPW